jgi:hypothetical protein
MGTELHGYPKLLEDGACPKSCLDGQPGPQGPTGPSGKDGTIISPDSDLAVGTLTINSNSGYPLILNKKVNSVNDKTNLISYRYDGNQQHGFGLDANATPWGGGPGPGWY